MILRQFLVPETACASYLFGCTTHGKLAVVDPHASLVEEYLTAAHEAGLREVRVIHGRGKGIQRGLVQQVLERHPLVVEFWDAPEAHLGATVARLLE